MDTLCWTKRVISGPLAEVLYYSFPARLKITCYCKLINQYFTKMLHRHTTAHILPLSSSMTALVFPFPEFFNTHTYIMIFFFHYTGIPICLSKWLLLTFWCSASNPQQLVKCSREGQFSCQKTVSKVRNARSLLFSEDIRGHRVIRSAKEPNITGLVHFCIFPHWKTTFSSLHPIHYKHHMEATKYIECKSTSIVMHLKFSRPSHLSHICYRLQHSAHNPLLKLKYHYSNCLSGYY